MNPSRFALRFGLTLLAFLFTGAMSREIGGDGRPSQVAQWMRFEAQFTSEKTYRNPLQDIQMEVDFTSPTGKQQTVLGFWDGMKTWRVRFSPEEIGNWSYRTRSSPLDSGLNGQTGEFMCVPYTGSSPLYHHGAIRMSENKRYMQHADGTPFFWLADTVWNGPLKADKRNWETFLDDRQNKKFSVIQFVTTQWIAATGNADARTAYFDDERIVIDPVFYRWIDERVDAINEHGLVASPVLIWPNWSKRSLALEPGISLPDEQIILLSKYMVARYGANQVIWILVGDSDYRGEKAERWKKIGRAVFGEHSPRLATMHPEGLSWVGDEFRNEPWFSFTGYQSGHGDSPEVWKWICQGPPSQDWKTEPHHPSINLELNYEGHFGQPTRKRVFDAHDVRRSAYWSLLVSPPAGVTYGAHGIWSWENMSAVPLGHPTVGIAPPWFEAMKMPGSTDMKYLSELFSSLEWWKLRPAQDLLIEQPGATDPGRYVTVAKAEGEGWALLYMPVGETIAMYTGQLAKPAVVRWFNPSTGTWSAPSPVDHATESFTPPDQNDWVLWVGPPK